MISGDYLVGEYNPSTFDTKYRWISKEAHDNIREDLRKNLQIMTKEEFMESRLEFVTKV